MTVSPEPSSYRHKTCTVGHRNDEVDENVLKWYHVTVKDS